MAQAKAGGTHLTDEKDVMLYLGYLLGYFHLEEWTVVLSDVPTKADEEGDSPPNAEIHTNDVRYCAVLQLGPNWPHLVDDAKRETLAHEVLHLMTKELRLFTNQWLMQVKPPDFVGMALNQVGDAEERMVDRLASCLAPYLAQYPGPLTDLPTNVRREKDWC